MSIVLFQFLGQWNNWLVIFSQQYSLFPTMQLYTLSYYLPISYLILCPQSLGIAKSCLPVTLQASLKTLTLIWRLLTQLGWFVPTRMNYLHLNLTICLLTPATVKGKIKEFLSNSYSYIYVLSSLRSSLFLCLKCPYSVFRAQFTSSNSAHLFFKFSRTLIL